MRINRPSVRLFLLSAIVILSLGVFVDAAILRGKVYDQNLNMLESVVIVVDSNPVQRNVVRDGTYEFSLPPGEYRLIARSFGDDLIPLGSDEKFMITREGTFVFDLVLTPLDSQQINQTFPPPPEQEPPVRVNSLLIGAVIAIFILIVAVVYFYFKSRKKPPKQDTDDVKSTLDSTTDEVLAIIRKEKHISQKDIRKSFDLSEAKISLILTELENLGYIKRIKKGRGNIIVYEGEKPRKQDEK